MLFKYHQMSFSPVATSNLALLVLCGICNHRLALLCCTCSHISTLHQFTPTSLDTRDTPIRPSHQSKQVCHQRISLCLSYPRRQMRLCHLVLLCFLRVAPFKLPIMILNLIVKGFLSANLEKNRKHVLVEILLSTTFAPLIFTATISTFVIMPKSPNH